MFALEDTHGGIGVAFTDRHGGASGGPFASLNLSDATGDDPVAVRDNLGRVAGALGVGDLALMHQVHGADVHRVAGPQDGVPVADALVTAVPELALVVRVADCVPVLLADRSTGVVGAAHAGRPGLVAGVVPRAVEAMRALGAGAVEAWVGPHVCGTCYEVPEAMREHVGALVPESVSQTSWGTPALDIGAGVRAQLAAAGVDPVREVARCTLEDDGLFSYRRQGRRSGRLAGLVWSRS